MDSKWVPDFLPRPELKDHPLYGWKIQHKGYFVQNIKFNSGVTIYFTTYSQDPKDLQAASPHAIFLDEECPQDIMGEILFRLSATDGHFHAVFTPTLGQEYWREAIEIKGEKERFKGANKQQVSMYDCLIYEDGTPSFWTEERIKRIEASCKSQAEIDRRVYGKFVLDSGLKYPGFVRDVNVIKEKEIPRNWRHAIGVDIGSGGNENHKSAVTFVAFNPEYTLGYIYKGKRFDGEVTTASDIVQWVAQNKSHIPEMQLDAVFFDWASVDAGNIAARMGENWIKAEKNHAIGEGRLNVLFRNRMLSIFDLPELEPLVYELMTLKERSRKTEGNDDACFIAGTKISTPSGDRNIEDLRVGDFVLTRAGQQRVTGTGSRLRSTVKLAFSGAPDIFCTPEHPFYTQYGWIKAINLTNNHVLLTFKEWAVNGRRKSRELQLSTKERCFTPIRAEHIPSGRTTAAARPSYTVEFGRSVLVKSHGVTTFTISTGISLITLSTISSLFLAVSTRLSIFLSGIRKIRIWGRGLFKKLFSLISGPTRRLFQGLSFAPFAERSLKLFGAGNLFIAARRAKTGFPEFGAELLQISPAGKNRVYNLTVENQPEYFANGILVHNCDSLRYAIAKLPIDWGSITGETPVIPEKILSETERRRQFWTGSEQVKFDVEAEFEEWNRLFDGA